MDHKMELQPLQKESRISPPLFSLVQNLEYTDRWETLGAG
jgi:hypothetical protein